MSCVESCSRSFYKALKYGKNNTDDPVSPAAHNDWSLRMYLTVLKQNSNIFMFIIVWSYSENVTLWVGTSFSWVFPIRFLKLPRSLCLFTLLLSLSPEMTRPCLASLFCDGLASCFHYLSFLLFEYLRLLQVYALKLGSQCHLQEELWPCDPVRMISERSLPAVQERADGSTLAFHTRVVLRPLLQNQPWLNSCLPPSSAIWSLKYLIKNVGFFHIFIKFWSQAEGRWVGGSKPCSVLWHVELLVGHILQLILTVTHIL